MATNQRQRILNQLEAGRLFLEGILRNPDIAARLTVFGVDSAETDEGTRLLGLASDAVTSQDRLLAEQKATTVAVESELKTAYALYTLASEVARAATGNDKTQLALLGITGKTPQTVATLLPRGKALLDGFSAHPELADLLGRHGQHARALAALKAAFDALADADARQQSAKGAAQRGTAQQTGALKNLAAWTSKTRRLARVAFRGDTQQLEKLGVVAR